MRTDIAGWLKLQWDRAGAWACLLAGVITLFAGWVGVSQTAYSAKQLPYIAGCGLGGLFLLGTGAMLWISADLRDEWRKLDRIETVLREHGQAALEELPHPAATALDLDPAGDAAGSTLSGPARPAPAAAGHRS
jgi:hypothetical protein